MKNALRAAASSCSIASILLLAACRGGSVVPAGPSAGAPSTGTNSPSAGRKVAVSIRIHLPRKHHKALRRARYLSPSVESIQIVINPAAGCATCSPETVVAGDLFQQSANCNVQLVCTLSFTALPGSYVLTVGTWDGLVDVNRNPTGNMLTENQNVGYTIVAGKQTFSRSRSTPYRRTSRWAPRAARVRTWSSRTPEPCA